MAAAKVKVGDTVLVRAGKDKGLRGTVLKVDRESGRVTVEGVNRVYRHQKSIPGAGSQNQVGGIITREAPIHISNVTRVEDAKKADKASKKADKASKKAEKAEKKSEKKTSKAGASDAAEVTDEKKVAASADEASADEASETEVAADETPAVAADETPADVAADDEDADDEDAEKKDES